MAFMTCGRLYQSFDNAPLFMLKDIDEIIEKLIEYISYLKLIRSLSSSSFIDICNRLLIQQVSISTQNISKGQIGSSKIQKNESCLFEYRFFKSQCSICAKNSSNTNAKHGDAAACMYVCSEGLIPHQNVVNTQQCWQLSIRNDAREGGGGGGGREVKAVEGENLSYAKRESKFCPRKNVHPFFPCCLKNELSSPIEVYYPRQCSNVVFNTMLSIFIHFHLYFPRLINNLHCVIQQFSFFLFFFCIYESFFSALKNDNCLNVYYLRLDLMSFALIAFLHFSSSLSYVPAKRY